MIKNLKSTNQPTTGFYMIMVVVMKELRDLRSTTEVMIVSAIYDYLIYD